MQNKDVISRSETYLIYRFLQPFTQWSQKTIGITCFFWANFFLTISMLVSVWALVYIFKVPDLIKRDTFSPLFHIGLIGMVFFRITSPYKGGILSIKRVAYRAMYKGCANPYINAPRISYIISFVEIWRRISQVIGYADDSPWIVCTLPIWLYWLGLACAACNPLPPKKSKLKCGIEKLVKALTSAPIPDPV